MDSLIRDWPGRRTQIQQLFTLLSRRVCQNIIIHGPASTGKTSVLKDVLHHFPAVRQAYITWCASIQVSQLLADILSQLRGSKRRRADGYAITCSKSSSETITHFLQELPAACGDPKERAIIVLDSAHTMAGQPVLEALMTARERTGVNLCVVLVSRVPMGWCDYDRLSELPAVASAYRLHFPQYNREDTLAVLMKLAPECADVMAAQPPAQGVDSRQLYRDFLDFCVYNAFGMYTRDVVELRQLARRLWPQFTRPLKVGAVRSPQELIAVASKSLLPAELRAFIPGVLATAREQHQSLSVALASGGLHMDLPESARLMLVAGYLASHNAPTLDKQVFDVQARSKRATKRSAQNADRQVEDAREAQLAGPHGFNVPRLLAIYTRLLQHRAYQAPIDIDTGLSAVLTGAPAAAVAGAGDGHGASHAGGVGAGGTVAPGTKEHPSSNPVVRLLEEESAGVLMQVPKLAAMRLFVQSGADDPLEGSQKYMCAIPQEMARQLARDLGMELHTFLRYA